MIRRIAELIRGTSSLVAIAALTIGIPAVLWQLGGLPGVRILGTLGDQLASDTSRTEALLSGTLLIVAWVCWAQLAYAIAIEFVAAARGQTSRQAAILPGLQALAARLVTSLTLISSSMLPTVHAVAAAAPLQPVMASPSEVTWDVGTIEELWPTSETRPAESAVATKSFVAETRDTFWSIAEATLGDGLRWTDIRDANLGRTMPDGTVITLGSETVEAGWDLRLPTDAVLPLSDETDVAAPVEVDVEPGDHFWAIAEKAMTDAWGREPSDTDVALYWADVVELNHDQLLPPDDPNFIYPGQVFELPAVPADPLAPEQSAVEPLPPEVEEPAAPEPAIVEPAAPTPTALEAPTTATAEEARPSPTALSDISIDQGSESSAPFVALGVGALGVSAGALALTLRRRRAHQAARREPGTRVDEAPLEAVEYEAAIRPIADTEAARWVEATNKFLTHRLAQADEAVLPAIIAMRAGQFGVEVLLDDPCDPPVGFVRTPEGPTTWRLDADLSFGDLEAEAAGAHPYSPGLLPVGRTTAGDLLVDFEQLGALSLAGQPERIAAWQRALAVAATATPWSHDCEVVAIGMPDDISHLPDVTVPPDPAAWTRACVAEMTKLNDRLADSPYRQRVATGEVFHPRIVLIGPDHDDVARQLGDAAALVNTPLAVLAVAELPGAEKVHFTDDGCVLEPYGLAFEPLASQPSEPVLLGELLENAETEPQAAAPDETEAVPPENGELESNTDIVERVMAPRPIEVGILTRQPKVHGLEKEIPTKQLSVLCYLAYHRDVSSQRLRDAFWPTATNRSTADNALSQLRTALGTGDDGEQRLTAATNTGNYELSDEVGCDWTRASALITEAKKRSDEDAADLLDAALSVLSGSPGADCAPGSFDWLNEDPSVYRRIESEVVDASHRLGEILLDQGRADQAAEAADRGLILVPGHEALYRIKLRAATAERAFDEVELLYSELCARLSDGGCWETPDKETEAIIAAARLQRAS
ncbi:MAG: LysM peptidoglycan-binding domain-containing protein [Acidimicrobiales bacterium]|nr:LysM peptidoglycan-binding domain-containing protein [Acidimicrobiales bacterium]GJM36928.1 MAG: hypothetical protein DHS20C19_02950 [Acidimicrobiales bacterium]